MLNVKGQNFQPTVVYSYNREKLEVLKYKRNTFSKCTFSSGSKTQSALSKFFCCLSNLQRLVFHVNSPIKTFKIVTWQALNNTQFLLHIVYSARTYLQPHFGNGGFRQCLPFSWTTLRDKHCRHPIAVMGVVDTFGHYHYNSVPT